MARTKTVEVGDVFGRLVVVRLYRERRVAGEGWRYLCDLRCECGEIRVSERGNLKSKSFNYECLRCSGNSSGIKRHGHSIPNGGSLEYKCYTRWQAMKRRCYSENDRRYHDYGGRGISVCDRWLESYENFLDDMGMPPDSTYQIDRIDNNGNYEPSNCQWVSRVTNGRNKRNNRIITANGESKTLVEWSEVTGIKRETISMRIKRGWSTEKSLGLV